jgi:D-amino-acid dehydrogenase
LRSGLLAGARRLGAVIMDASARLESTPAGSLAVHTPDREIGADVVVVAAGAWANSVLEPLCYQIAVEPQRGQIVHLQVEGSDTAGWPSVLPVAGHYIVPFDGGRVVVGATRETGSGFDARITAAGVGEVLNAQLILTGSSDLDLSPFAPPGR